MKVRVVRNNPRDVDFEADITHLIGQEFNVIFSNEKGYYIDGSSFGSPEYFFYKDEVEIVT